MKEVKKGKKCACGCGEIATLPYVQKPNGDVLATRACYEKYTREHPVVYAPPSSPVPNPAN